MLESVELLPDLNAVNRTDHRTANGKECADTSASREFAFCHLPDF